MSDHLNEYMKSIKKIDLDQDIFELSKKYKKTGCPKTKEIIIKSCLQYVVSIARKYTYEDSEGLLELIHAGNLGLVEAVERYDPEKGVQLITYATWSIKRRILEHIRDFYRETKCPSIKRHIKLFYNIRKYTDTTQALSAESVTKLKKAYNVSDEDIDLMYNFVFNQATYVDSDENNYDTDSLLFANPEDNPESLYIKDELLTIQKNVLQESLNNLSDRQRDIAKRRWYTETPDTLTEIGNDYSVSAEAIRIDEKKAKKKIRESATDIPELIGD